MKAQFLKNGEIHYRPAITRPRAASSWPLLPGLLLSDVGFLLIAFAGLEGLSAKAHILVYLSGAILCAVGLVLIWIGTIKLARTTTSRGRGLEVGRAASPGPAAQNVGHALVSVPADRDYRV